MIDDESQIYTELSQKDCERIESTVVKLFIKLGINKFPIDTFAIAKQLGYMLVPYSRANESVRKLLQLYEMSGASIRTKKGVYKIFYDDYNVIERQRFTIMHEIGHIQLSHRENSDYAEKCADHYASYALAPSPIVDMLPYKEKEEIMACFWVSPPCSYRVLKRYNEWQSSHNEFKPYEIQLKNMINGDL